MNLKFRKLLRLFLAVVFLLSLGLLVRQQLDKQRGEDAYEQAQSLAAQTQPTEAPTAPPETEPPRTEPPETEPPEPIWVPAPIPEDDEYLAELQALDIAALQAENPDVVGWIFVPDSRINYPLMQGEDNDFYLHHTWQKQENRVGSIFIECKNKADMTNFNTIIYGHSMADGSMFADVIRYFQEWYFTSHPYVYIVLPDQILRYEVFAAYQAPVDSQVYGLSYNQVETRQRLLQHALDNAVCYKELGPQVTDRYLTLSTCTGAGYDKRNVIIARLPMIEVIP